MTHSSTSRAAALAALLLSLASLVSLAWWHGAPAGRADAQAGPGLAAPLETGTPTATRTLEAATVTATRTVTPGPPVTATATPCPAHGVGTAVPDADRCKYYYPAILDGFPILEPRLTLRGGANNTAILSWSLSAQDAVFFTPTPGSTPANNGGSRLQWIVRRSSSVMSTGQDTRLLNPEDVCVLQETVYQIGAPCPQPTPRFTATPGPSPTPSSSIIYYQVVAVTAWQTYASNVVASFNVATPLVWSEYRNGNWDIWKFDGANAVNLTADLSASDEIEPVISPNGQSIAFASNVVPPPQSGGTPTASRANYEIYRMGVDGSGRTQLTQTTERTSVHPSWSSDGRRLAFTTDAGTFNTLDIFVIDAFPSASPVLIGPGAAEQNRLTWPDAPPTVRPSPTVPVPTPSPTTTPKTDPTATPTATLSVYDNYFRQSTSRQASWSPDGTRIAFVSNRPSGNQGCGQDEIYVMRSDGRAQQRVTCSRGQNLGPRWSPDGQRLVFVSNRDGNWEIYTIRPDGAEERRLTNNQSTDTQPSWVATGREIVFVGLCPDPTRPSAQPGLCLISPDRNEPPRLILPTQGDVYAPSWGG